MKRLRCNLTSKKWFVFVVLGYFLLFECMLESIIFARNHYLTSENGLSKFSRRSTFEKSSFLLQFCPTVLRSTSRRFILNVFMKKTSDFGRMFTDSKWIQWWKIFSPMVTWCWSQPKICSAIRFASKFETKKSKRNETFFVFHLEFGHLHVFERRHRFYASVYRSNVKNGFDLRFCLFVRCEFLKEFDRKSNLSSFWMKNKKESFSLDSFFHIVKISGDTLETNGFLSSTSLSRWTRWRSERKNRLSTTSKRKTWPLHFSSRFWFEI